MFKTRFIKNVHWKCIGSACWSCQLVCQLVTQINYALSGQPVSSYQLLVIDAVEWLSSVSKVSCFLQAVLCQH